MTAVLLQGLGLGAGLIIAIGSQNAFVLLQGLRREHHFAVAGVCFLSDALLIALGGAGVGTLIASKSWLADSATILGAGFLVIYGWLTFLKAFRPERLHAAREGSSTSLKRVLSAAVGFSLLNPHAWLDTVVLLGGISGQFPSSERPWFIAGAMLASFVWFFALATAAARLAPWLENPRTWRILDTLIALVMWWIAGALLVSRFL